MAGRNKQQHLHAKHNVSARQNEEVSNQTRQDVLKPLVDALRRGTYHRDAYKVAEKVIQAHLIPPV